MKRKLHWQHHLPYPSAIAWVKCGRHVERSQVAAFEAGVTCKVCLAAIEWDRAERAQREYEKTRRPNATA